MPSRRSRANLDSQSLRVFLRIAELGSFRAASSEFFIAQSSLSRLIGKLEKDLGVTLFERSSSGVNLTHAGRKLETEAQRLLETVDRVIDSVSLDRKVRLQLGTSATAAGSFLAPFLSDWIPRNLDVELTILEGGAAALRTHLSRRDCDIAIVASPVPTSCEYLPLTKCTLVAIPPPDHPLTQLEGSITIKKLGDAPLLVNGRDFLTTKLLLAAYTQAQLVPNIIYESGVGQTLASLAEAGLGVAVISDTVDLRGFDLPKLTLVDNAGMPLTFDLNVAWWDRGKSSPARRFSHDLIRYFQRTA